MKVILCVTRDMVTGDATTSPIMVRNEVDAERSWATAIVEAARDPKVPAKDFQLYKIADFDTETLVITPDLKFLHNAQEFLVTNKVESVSEVSDGIHDNV